MHALPENPGRTIFTITFWADAIERAISTAAATAVSVLTVGNAAPDLITAPWLVAGSAAGGAAILDLLRSLAAAGRGNPGTASMIRATKAGTTPDFVARFTGGHAR